MSGKLQLDCDSDCQFCRRRECHCGCGYPTTFNKDGPTFGYRIFAQGHYHHYVRQHLNPAHGRKFARQTFLWAVQLAIKQLLTVEPMTAMELSELFGSEFPLKVNGLSRILGASHWFEQTPSGYWALVDGPSRRRRVGGTRSLTPPEDFGNLTRVDSAAMRPDDIAAMDEIMAMLTEEERAVVVSVAEYGMIEAAAVKCGIATPHARLVAENAARKMANAC